MATYANEENGLICHMVLLSNIEMSSTAEIADLRLGNKIVI